MTGELRTFPEPNLNPAAYPWARQVQARIVDREREDSSQADRIKSLGQAIIALQRRQPAGGFNYLGEIPMNS